MIVFPNAKINLGLHIVNKRNDGFHEIESCLYPIPVTDALEMLPSEKMSFNSSGNTIPGPSSDNLILKAYQVLKADFPQLPPVAVHLHKNIPIGAGLGGGSADAAFSVTMLNELFDLGMESNKLEKYASQLGSDCPFFIQNQPKLVHGRGEILNPVDLSLSGNWIYLVHPGIHISTKDAYAGVIPKAPSQSLKVILKDKEDWKEQLVNDFEDSIFKKQPIIRAIKSRLYESGAFYAAMSGSGSSVFGLFKNPPKQVKFPEEYFQFCKELA